MVLVEFKPPCGLREALDRLSFDYVFLNAVQLIDRLQTKKPKNILKNLLKIFTKLEIALWQRHRSSSNRHKLSQLR